MGWRADLFMTCVAVLPPVYFLPSFISNPDKIHTSSPIWLAILGIGYIWVLSTAVFPFFTSPLRSLPTPSKESFLFGNGGKVFKRPPGTGILEVALDTPNDGIIMFRGIAHWRTSLILTNPSTVMEVLNGHTYDWEKPAPARRFLARVLGEGLVNVEGNEHKQQRRAVAPAFSGRHIKDLVPLFWKKSQDFADAISRESKEAADRVVEIRSIVSRVTLDIIGAAGIGKDFNSLNNPDDELASLYSTITDTNKGSMLAFFIVNMIFPPWVVRMLPWKVSRMVAQAQKRLRAIVKDLLEEKRQAMEMKTAEQKDIIATIMRSGIVDPDYLTNQLLTFLAAGHETTAAALTWTTWLLTTNSEAQKRLRKECQEHLSGLSPDQITAEVFDNMPYLNAVCMETLRLYPTVPGTARISNRKTRINDVVVPKGTFCLITPWMLNRLPSLWGPDATEYKPERWLEGSDKFTQGGSHSPYSMITFLYGPRSCIGQAFAKYELKTLLAAMVLRFSWVMRDPNEKIIPEGVVTIKPKNGMHLVMTELKA